MPNLDLFKNFENPSNFKQGDVLLVEGSPGHVMYAIQEGQVEIRIGSQKLTEIGPGEFFGEMALIDQQGRSGTIVALTDGVMVPITRERFMFLVQNHPFFAIEVMRTLVERLRSANRISAQPKPA